MKAFLIGLAALVCALLIDLMWPEVRPQTSPVEHATAPGDFVVSQKGRQFHPGEVFLAQGGTLLIVNDDGNLQHHAYVSSPEFSFDSGDQTPGSQTRVVFNVPGNFRVLCGIHPKMKLIVHVGPKP